MSFRCGRSGASENTKVTYACTRNRNKEKKSKDGKTQNNENVLKVLILVLICSDHATTSHHRAEDFTFLRFLFKKLFRLFAGMEL